MKRLFVAFALICLSVALCFFSSRQVENHTVKMQEELREIAKVISQKDTDKAQAMLTEAGNSWQETEKLFSMIVDAEKIEEVSIGFSMIKANLSDKNIEHALERLRECELMLDEIAEDEKLSIKNIM